MTDTLMDETTLSPKEFLGFDSLNIYHKNLISYLFCIISTGNSSKYIRAAHFKTTQP